MVFATKWHHIAYLLIYCTYFVQDKFVNNVVVSLNHTHVTLFTHSLNIRGFFQQYSN